MLSATGSTTRIRTIQPENTLCTPSVVTLDAKEQELERRDFDTAKGRLNNGSGRM